MGQLNLCEVPDHTQNNQYNHDHKSTTVHS
jgi:hypothetical protein